MHTDAIAPSWPIRQLARRRATNHFVPECDPAGRQHERARGPLARRPTERVRQLRVDEHVEPCLCLHGRASLVEGEPDARCVAHVSPAATTATVSRAATAAAARLELAREHFLCRLDRPVGRVRGLVRMVARLNHFEQRAEVVLLGQVGERIIMAGCHLVQTREQRRDRGKQLGGKGLGACIRPEQHQARAEHREQPKH